MLENEKEKTAANPVSQAVIGNAPKKNFFLRLPRKNPKFIFLGLIIALVLGGAGYIAWNKYWLPSRLDTATKVNNQILKANDAVLNNDTAAALSHAKAALEIDPNDYETIMAVAVLTEKNNPEEAKQYYLQAYKIMQKEDRPDEDGKSPIIYFAAAELAEKADLRKEAKAYYQKVIDTADPNDKGHEIRVLRAREALRRFE